MKILIKKTNGLVIPKRGKPDDACYDITAVSDPIIVGEKFEMPLDGINGWRSIKYIEYLTNIHIAPQDEDNIKFHTLVFARSSISSKNLVLANSVANIDHAYCGEIKIHFKYIVQPSDLIIVPENGRQRLFCALSPESLYKKGDRIAQIKACENIDIEFVEVEQLNNTERGTGGFGSTN